MKKLQLSLVAVALGLVAAGCYVPNNTYNGVLPGLLYTQETHTNHVGTQLTDASHVKIVKPVHGSATAINILGLVAAGDCSVRDAKADALEDIVAADDVLNMQVSTRVFSILGIFTSITTQVDGVAIRYHR